MLRTSNARFWNRYAGSRIIRIVGICGSQNCESLYFEKETGGSKRMSIVVIAVLIIGTSLLVQWASKL